MTEQQIQETVQRAVTQAIQVERARMADIFRNAMAEFSTNLSAEVHFDFEASCERIADAIESNTPCAKCDDDPAEPGSSFCVVCKA